MQRKILKFQETSLYIAHGKIKHEKIKLTHTKKLNLKQNSLQLKITFFAGFLVHLKLL